MIATKGKVLAVLAFVFLASSITIANASQTRTPFYFIASDFAPIGELRYHWADDAVVVITGALEGVVKDASGNTVGTMTLDKLVIIRNFITQTSTNTAQFVINFYSGAIIKGTMTFKVTYAPPPIFGEGKFAGHGDMNVKGDVYSVPGSTTDMVLDGYSW